MDIRKMKKLAKHKSSANHAHHSKRNSGSIATHQVARLVQQECQRAERRLVREDLRLAARGNPWRDELEAIEAEFAEGMMEDYRYFQSAERNWFEYEEQLEREREVPEHMLWEGDAWDDDWSDEEARGLNYSRVDTDDNLML